MFKGQFKMWELAPAQGLSLCLFAMHTVKTAYGILKRGPNYNIEWEIKRKNHGTAFINQVGHQAMLDIHTYVCIIQWNELL